MKRFLPTVLLVLACWSVSYAQTQERGNYFGVGAFYATGLYPNYPRPSVQVGGPLSETSALELRGTLTSLLVQSTLGLELLYPTGLAAENVRLYAGGGLMTRFYFYAPDGFYLDAILGGELFFESELGSRPPVRRTSDGAARTFAGLSPARAQGRYQLPALTKLTGESA